MTMRTMTCAAIVGLAGVFAWTATSIAAPKAKATSASYENMGAKPGMAPPVPGFALAGYKPGLCWKVQSRDYQTGSYVPCSDWQKK